MLTRFGCTLVLAFAIIFPTASAPAGAQMTFGVNPAFLGTWCAEGDPTRQTSIAATITGVQLTNEQGSTSIGEPSGPTGSQITALQWNLVQGTLSPDGRRISWSNNTYWARCARPARDTLDGTWYASGDPSRVCSIRQRYGELRFENEAGMTAVGSFTGRRSFTATWSGVPIAGTVRDDGNRIDWGNGTYWTRVPH